MQQAEQRSAGEQRAASIETSAEGLLKRAEGLRSRPDLLYRDPGGDEWTVMRVLGHTAEILPYWTRQAQHVAGRPENGQPFGRTHDDPDRIAAVESYANQTLDEALTRVRAGLAECTSALRALPAGSWSRTATHSRRGEMTVEQIVDQFIVEHVEEHREQAEKVLREFGV